MKRVIAVAVLIIVAVLACVLFEKYLNRTPEEEIKETVIEQKEVLQQTEPEDNLQNPIDFASLQELNPDIYAWLEVPEIVSLPIVNRPGDDSYYHRRAVDGTYSLAGSLYTEDYNSRDFSDPVTLIYGHNMNTDEMFSVLEPNYTNKEYFDSHLTMTIYMPNEIKHYTIMAAVPYGNIHILDAYDFTNSRIFRLFFEDILDVREVNANFNTNISVTPQDRVVILSTCLNGNDSKRYLVVAVENKK